MLTIRTVADRYILLSHPFSKLSFRIRSSALGAARFESLRLEHRQLMLDATAFTHPNALHVAIDDGVVTRINVSVPISRVDPA
jgi:hypothetical protein